MYAGVRPSGLSCHTMNVLDYKWVRIKTSGAPTFLLEVIILNCCKPFPDPSVIAIPDKNVLRAFTTPKPTFISNMSLQPRLLVVFGEPPPTRD